MLLLRYYQSKRPSYETFVIFHMKHPVKDEVYNHFDNNFNAVGLIDFACLFHVKILYLQVSELQKSFFDSIIIFVKSLCKETLDLKDF